MRAAACQHRTFPTGLFRCLALVLASAVVACDEGPRTVTDRLVEDPWAFAQSTMAEGPLLVQVEGDPFDAGTAALEAAVIDAMTTAVTWTGTARFAADPDAVPNPDLRVVFTFNGTAGLSGRQQCLGHSSGGGPSPDGRIDASASFCDGPTQLATVRGEVTDRSDGRAFAALIRQITIDMLSPRQRGD
ncbi:MAG: hypothetical protein EA406_01370 [Rhodospirillales bacterium]|nr:MAG: hypothetical protein EA406_01370 [Rhodospirillales bacterium]